MKKSIKAVLSILIAAAICFSFYGCNFGVIRNNEPSKKNESGSVSIATTAETTTAADTTSGAATTAAQNKDKNKSTGTTTKASQSTTKKADAKNNKSSKNKKKGGKNATQTKPSLPKNRSAVSKSCVILSIEYTKVGGNYIVKNYPCKYKKGDTVYTVLKRVCKQKKISIGEKDTGYGKYIYSINGIDENYAGQKKGGWTYTLNGEMVMKSVDDCAVKKGDKLIFSYVLANDYTTKAG